jgi:hypothetical protein
MNYFIDGNFLVVGKGEGDSLGTTMRFSEGGIELKRGHHGGVNLVVVKVKLGGIDIETYFYGDSADLLYDEFRSLKPGKDYSPKAQQLLKNAAARMITYLVQSLQPQDLFSLLSDIFRIVGEKAKVDGRNELRNQFMELFGIRE